MLVLDLQHKQQVDLATEMCEGESNYCSCTSRKSGLLVVRVDLRSGLLVELVLLCLRRRLWGARVLQKLGASHASRVVLNAAKH